MAQRPELLGVAAPDHLCERAPDGRLLGEPQVVADPEIGRRDGVVGRRFDPRRLAQRAHQMTFAKLGSRRLNTIVVRARKIVLATSRTASDSRLGGPLGGAVRRPVDHRAIGLEQDRERVGVGERRQEVALLEDPQVVEAGQAVQAGRQEPPQPQDVPDHVAQVPEEDVAGRDQERAGEGEHELDRGDDRDEHQPGRDPVREEDHQHAQRDGPEREADDARRWTPPRAGPAWGTGSA